jgi:signal transduction histidine kinase
VTPSQVRALVGAAALALGVAAADAARRAPEFALTGDSVARLALGIAAGWALVTAGLVLGADGERRSGPLLAAAGCAWLATGLGTPGARGEGLFTLGLVVIAGAPALTGHALLAATRDPHHTRLDQAALALLYGSLAGLLGVLPALAYDPGAAGCGSCPENLLQITDSPDAVAFLSRWGVRLGLPALACIVALVVWRLARAPAARRLRATPLVLPGCAYLGLFAASLGHSLERGFLGSDTVDQALWAGQAAALLAIAAGVAWLHAAGRRRRSQLARLVVNLSDAQRTGGLRDALANLLGDPGLDVLYANRAEGGWIDSTGQVRTPPPELATTPLVREQKPVALLCHRPGLLDDPRLAPEIERSVRLGLEHERLDGELRRQLAQLRRSRADIVAAAEAERRLLERDLHDGAQQRLVAFAFAIGVARRHAPPQHAAALASAQQHVQEALGELRELAHGLYPVALADAGLAAAVESLSDRRPGLHVSSMPTERFTPAVEETAYFAIAGMVDHWSPQPMEFSAAADGERLVIELCGPAGPPTDLIAVEDRLGALGGTLVAEDGPTGESYVRVELPCA